MKFFNLKLFACAVAITVLHAAVTPTSAEAGPLLDWLRGCRRKCNQPTCAPAYAGQPLAGCGLQPGQCQVTCNQTCSRVVVNYVPYTAYRTAWEQVPVTQYKPVTSSDPCTGCTVTCMKPCTSYSWQMKQVPYTTYRPCYRTENYTVPVSYVTNDCATGSCPTGNCATGACGIPNTAIPSAASGCNTCGVPTAAYSNGQVITGDGTLTSGSYYSAPQGTGYGTGGAPTPADSVPAIQGVNPQSMQRPIMEQLQTIPAGSSYYTPPQPVQANLQTRQAPVVAPETKVARQEWGYSPVRLAGYVRTSDDASKEVRGTWNQPKTSGHSSKINSAWQTANW